MTDRSTLQRRPGILVNRIEPAGWTPPEGSHVWCFGSDEPGWTGFFGPTDAVQIKQIGGYGSARLVRATGHLRGPRVAPPSGWKWIAYGAVGGVVFWSYELVAGRETDLLDLAIPVQPVGAASEYEFGLFVQGPGGAEPVELEIPAFYLDAIVLDELAPKLAVANMSPARGETRVEFDPTTPVITFDLLSFDGDAQQSALDVYVAGVKVVSAGVAIAGWAFSFAVLAVGQAQVNLQPPSGWGESGEDVVVRVVDADSTGNHVDASYDFVLEDVLGPVVLAAQSLDHMTVRVSFDESVVQTDATATNDALNPASWALAALTAPAFVPAVVSITPVSPTVVDVTLDKPLTQGATYRITATVADLVGNVSTDPTNHADFVAFACDEPAGRDFTLYEMVAQKHRDEDATRDLEKFLGLLQEPLGLILCDVDVWTDILDVDRAAERFVDQMLITLGNPFDFDLDLNDKRKLVRVLPRIYELKGTAPGVIAVIRFFLGIEVTITAYASEGWILGEDELGVGSILGPSTSFARFSFDVTSPVALTDEQRTRIRALVDYMKPAHTHFINLIEPTIPEVIDHLELGLSELGGDEWMLH